MGNGASILEDSPIDKAQAEALAGDKWLEIEPQFVEAQDAEGLVTAIQAKEFISRAAIVASSAEESEVTRRFSMISDHRSLSEGDSLWKYLRAAASAYSFLKVKEDMKNSKVKQMMKMIAGMPCLAEQNLDQKIRSAAMTALELERRHEARRSRVRREAEARMAEFELLSEEDKKLAINDGNLEHYSPENQQIRESIFDDDIKVNQLLDRWWSAAEQYIDRDKSSSLSADEYAVFYKRLCRLVFISEGGEEQMTEDEINEAMQIDFKADSGDDGSVSHEEFRYAVFQLADQWTNSCDVEEYVEFLKKGFEVVFSDLVSADKVQLPENWVSEMKGVKSITAMPINRCVDLITSMIYDKIKADKVDIEQGNEIADFSVYVQEWFQNEYGLKPAKKRFKSFVSRLTALLSDETHPVYDYALLFAQLCGLQTMTGRIVPLPSSAGGFILSILDDVLDKIHLPKERVKQTDDFNDDEDNEDKHQNQNNSHKNNLGYSHKIGVDAKSNVLIHGMLESRKGNKLLHHVLINKMKIDETSPLYRIAFLALEGLTVETPNTGGLKRNIMSMKFTVLLGVIFAAWNGDDGGVDKSLDEDTMERLQEADGRT